MTLRLIHGGQGGGKPPPPPSDRKKRRRRRNDWLVDLLWYSISRAYFPSRANDTHEITERMTRLTKQIVGQHYVVTERQAIRAIELVRSYPLFYGWDLPFVQKGDQGLMRGYLPIQVDYDPSLGPVYLLDDSDLMFVKAGLVSWSGGFATTCRRSNSIYEIASMIWPDEFSDIVSELRRIIGRIDKVAAKSRVL